MKGSGELRCYAIVPVKKRLRIRREDRSRVRVRTMYTERLGTPSEGTAAPGRWLVFCRGSTARPRVQSTASARTARRDRRDRQPSSRLRHRGGPRRTGEWPAVPGVLVVGGLIDAFPEAQVGKCRQNMGLGPAVDRTRRIEDSHQQRRAGAGCADQEDESVLDRFFRLGALDEGLTGVSDILRFRGWMAAVSLRCLTGKPTDQSVLCNAGEGRGHAPSGHAPMA